MQITERACLWYGSFRSRTVRVILVRDDNPELGAATTAVMGFR